MKKPLTLTLTLRALALFALAALMLAMTAALPAYRVYGESAVTTGAEPTAAPTPKPTLFQTIGNNIGFILTALAISAVVVLIGLFFQRLFFKNRVHKVNRTRRITYTALFSSMAGVLMLLEFPLFFAPYFYKLDISEIPVMICAFFMGPVYGVIAEFIKVVLHTILKGTTTAFVGDFANFIVGCSFVLPASIIYHYKPGRNTALIGLIAGTLCMTVFGSAFNAFYLIPKFAELFMPMEQIIAVGTAVNKRITSVGSLVMWAVVPFNLVKGIIVSLVTFFIYKPISHALKLEFHKPKAR